MDFNLAGRCFFNAKNAWLKKVGHTFPLSRYLYSNNPIRGKVMKLKPHRLYSIAAVPFLYLLLMLFAVRHEAAGILHTQSATEKSSKIISNVQFPRFAEVIDE